MGKQWLRLISAGCAGLALAAGLIACQAGSDQLAGGGIGGTGGIGGAGFGEITGFGSILFNEDGIFDTDAETEFFIDGVKLDSEDAFKAAFGGSDDAVGAVAIVEVRDDVDDGFTSGTAARVDARTALKGPVTGIDPLQVLGQMVVVTGSTVLADLGDITELTIGDLVEVSGFTQDTNLVSATRLQRKTALDEWKLTGFVTSSGAGSFDVGVQTTVSLSGGVSARDCGGAPVPPAGRFVEIKAVPAAGFIAGDDLIASDVECKLRGLSGELDGAGVTLRRVQGFISAISGNPVETVTIGGTGVDGQVIRLTNGTVFSGGTREDIAIGVKIEVRGQFDTANSELTAARVSFRETRVRIEATLEPANVNPGAGTLTLLGITIHRLPITEDDDNFFGGGQPARDVRMRGYVDRDGTVYATEIDDRDDAGDEDLRLRGPVDPGFSNPNFSILGVQIILGAGTLFKDDDVVISQAEFFARLTPGRPVQVDVDIDDGSFDPVGKRLINPEEVELED